MQGLTREDLRKAMIRYRVLFEDLLVEAVEKPVPRYEK